MQLFTTAIIPVLAIFALGTVLHRRYFTSAELWQGLGDLTYYVFTPLLFVGSIGQTDLSVVPVLSLATSLVVPVLVIAAVLVLLRRPLRADGPALASLVQGSIRLNTYVGLVIVAALHGQEGIATFALAAAVMVPLVNVVSVSAHSVFVPGGPDAPRQSMWRELVTNPLILGCVAGLAINLTNLPMPSAVVAFLDLLSAPALACGTLVTGAGLVLRFHGHDAVQITIASLLKLLALPVGAALLATAFGVPPVVRDSIVVICALPTAPSAYVLATRLGGDTRLMASVTGVQTVLAMATLPLILAWAGG